MRKPDFIRLLAGLSLLVIIFSMSYENFMKLAGEDESEEEEDQPHKFREYYEAITTRFTDNQPYPAGYQYLEFKRALQQNSRLKSAHQTLPWVSRGPWNVAGRVRSMVVDPSDTAHKTWFAGSASGGIWKTTDAGNSWNNLTPGLSNLSTSCLAISKNNPDILYAGTGEGFFAFGMVQGNGIFKSTDHGVTWNFLASTAGKSDFYFINRLLVSPSNPDVVVAATNTGILKSTNGGISWKKTYVSILRVQDIEPEPGNFNILYAGENSKGVVRSTDMGDSWSLSSSGMGKGGRVELAVSSVNPSKVFACVETDQSGTDVYVSNDKGLSWRKFRSTTTAFVNYLQEQGWYDNTIVCDPYDENTVYIGGIYLGKYSFSSEQSESVPQVIRVDTFKTSAFLNFVNFGGSFLDGGMQTGDKNQATGLTAGDWAPVEIRFGNGIKQKAHRFTVPDTSGTGHDGGAGVLASSYQYRDYVDVPFQVWDTKNNVQLMVSFRDQERDGKFNLIRRIAGNEVAGREYLYIHGVKYGETPDTSIARWGGHCYKQLYFFWPTLVNFAAWTPDYLPSSVIRVEYGRYMLQSGSGTIISDNRGDQGGLNSNLHADHHQLVVLPVDSATRKFWMISANDGGIGLSQNSGETWVQLTNGMINTQFYGVDKKPGVEEYIGGTQDNGTWQSPPGVKASSGTKYIHRIGGDGFAVIWHPVKTDQIIGSSYNNNFYLSRDGGKSWSEADKNIDSDGPFITRLGFSPANPDVLFAVGKDGIWRSKTFGYYTVGGWSKIPVGNGWKITDDVTSQHNVCVSLANPDIVWAGAGMNNSPYLSLFVSTNGGDSFNPAGIYSGTEMGYISGLATHPVNPKEAFALFSFNGAPKILRTMDLGRTWKDISGFGTGSSSTNGFPNVAVNALLVMPFDTSWIWAGTEIGLFESRDNGITWSYADNGLPAVSIWQMKTVDNEVIVATHGRGIWTTTIPGSTLSIATVEPETVQLSVYPVPADDILHMEFEDPFEGKVIVYLYDMLGKPVLSGAYEKSSGLFSETLNVDRLPDGIYTLVVEWDKKRTVKKIRIR